MENPANTPVPLQQTEKAKEPETGNHMESQIFFGSAKTRLLRTKIVNVEEVEWLMKYVLPADLNDLKQKYRLSENSGFEAKKFHSRCDGLAPTFLLCQASNGTKFGAVSFVFYNSQGASTNRNLIFSLDKLSIHRLKIMNGSRISANAIRNDPASGPILGDYDLVIGDNCHQEMSCSSNLGQVYEFEGDGETYLTGSKKFSMSKVIVFHMVGCNTMAVSG